MDISNILTNLKEEDIAKLKNMASSLFGEVKTTANNETENTENIEDASKSFENTAEEPYVNETMLSVLGGGTGDFANTLSNVNKMLNAKDERCDFLIALKPFLKAERQIRVDQAVKMLRLMNMLPMLKESGFLNNFLKTL